MIGLVVIGQLALATAAHETWPDYLDADQAAEHAWHAERAASEENQVPADLLLAVAAVETHFRPTVVSVVRGKRFCGILQSQAGRSKRRCRDQQALGLGYQVGAHELAAWIRYRKGDLRAALRGYACGIRAKRTCGSHGGRKRPYDLRVLDGLRRLQARRGGP